MQCTFTFPHYITKTLKQGKVMIMATTSHATRCWDGFELTIIDYGKTTLTVTPCFVRPSIVYHLSFINCLKLNWHKIILSWCSTNLTKWSTCRERLNWRTKLRFYIKITDIGPALLNHWNMSPFFFWNTWRITHINITHMCANDM